MSALKYADFYSELIENMLMKPKDVPGFIREQTKKKLGYEIEISLEEVYEFLKGRSCPRADKASIWETAFGVQLAPRYYGVGVVFKPGRLPLS